MGNVELLNICYKYMNDSIDKDKLLELLNNIDKTNLSKKDIIKTNDLINSIKEVDNGTNNIVNYKNILNIIINNDYFNECFDNLTDYELLKFIASYIKASLPPKIDEDKFNRLIDVGIQYNEKEYLWRLIFNYLESDFNFDKVIDYYINTLDGYYLAESISAFGDRLDINNIIDKINDKNLIIDLLNRKSVISHYVNDEMINRLKRKVG